MEEDVEVKIPLEDDEANACEGGREGGREEGGGSGVYLNGMRDF